MRSLLRNSKFIFSSKTLAIYSKKPLEEIVRLSETAISSCELTDEFLILGFPSGLVKIITISSITSRCTDKDLEIGNDLGGNRTADGGLDHNHPAVSQITTVSLENTKKCRVTSIHCNGQLLYIGYDSGTIQTWVCNSKTRKLLKEQDHHAPVFGLISDGICLYVTDHRNKITEYPGGQAYDFHSPKIYYNRYLICVEDNKIFVKTRETPGLLYEHDRKIIDLHFSEKGGYFYIVSEGSTICVDPLTGEKQDEWDVENGVVAGDILVVEEGNELLIFDLFIVDKELESIDFRKIGISTKKLEAEEFDKKYAFIDDGNKKRLPKMLENKKPGPLRTETIGMSDKSGMTGKSRREEPPDTSSFTITEESDASAPKETSPPVHKTSLSDNPYGLRKGPIPVTVGSTTLLAFTPEGYMLQTKQPFCNQIQIKFHDNKIPPVEIRTEDEYTVGAFYKANCALGSPGRLRVSTGSSERLNFGTGSLANLNADIGASDSPSVSRSWTKETNVRKLCMNKSFVFVVADDVAIYNYSGGLVCELYNPGVREICCSESQLAIASEDTCAIYHLKNSAYLPGKSECGDPSGSTGSSNEDCLISATEYIPVKSTTFMAYKDGILHLKTPTDLFKVVNSALIKLCRLLVSPIGVAGKNVLSLQEPIVLSPRLMIDYTEIKKSSK